MIRLVPAALLAALLAGCAPRAPHLYYPDRVDSFCADRSPKLTAIQSVVTSSEDARAPWPVPPPAAIRGTIVRDGGVIAHWNRQPLYLPHIAKSLGIVGEYVTIGDAAIDNGPAGNGARRLYLTVDGPGGTRTTIAVRAFDLQDVCNEGRLSA